MRLLPEDELFSQEKKLKTSSTTTAVLPKHFEKLTNMAVFHLPR